APRLPRVRGDPRGAHRGGDLLAGGQVMIPPPADMHERIRAAVQKTPTSGFSPRNRAIVAIVSVLVAIAIGIARMRPDFAALPFASLVGVSLGIAFLAAATLVVALSPG